jgi:hypothetical protein
MGGGFDPGSTRRPERGRSAGLRWRGRSPAWYGYSARSRLGTCPGHNGTAGPDAGLRIREPSSVPWLQELIGARMTRCALADITEIPRCPRNSRTWIPGACLRPSVSARMARLTSPALIRASDGPILPAARSDRPATSTGRGPFASAADFVSPGHCSTRGQERQSCTSGHLMGGPAPQPAPGRRRTRCGAPQTPGLPATASCCPR